MKRFIIIAQQDGGCDYTIGCGIRYWFEYGASIQEVKDSIQNKLLDDDDDDDRDYELGPHRLKVDMWSEGAFDTLDIYELGENHSAVPLTELANQLKKNQENARTKKNDTAEKAEFERLQKKFDPNYKPKPVPVLDKACSACEKEFKTEKVTGNKCEPCEKKELLKVEERRLEYARKTGIINHVLQVLSDNDWKTNPMYQERQSGKVKVDSMGLIYFYDQPRVKGRKTTYGWRQATFEEARDLLPKKVVKIYEENTWLMR